MKKIIAFGLFLLSSSVCHADRWFVYTSTPNVSCGTGYLTTNGNDAYCVSASTSGGSGVSTLAVGTGTVSNFTNNVTSPTAAISFDGTFFKSIGAGTTNFITIDTISATGLLSISSAVATYFNKGTNLPVSNLNSGTGAGGTTFWRGDGTWATPASGGGASLLAVTTGSASGFSSLTSSPTAVLNFDSNLFKASLTGSATAFITLSASSATLMGNLASANSNLTIAQGVGITTFTVLPSGSNTQVQFNDNSVFGGNANLTFNKSTNVLLSSGTRNFYGSETITQTNDDAGAGTRVVTSTFSHNTGAAYRNSFIHHAYIPATATRGAYVLQASSIAFQGVETVDTSGAILLLQPSNSGNNSTVELDADGQTGLQVSSATITANQPFILISALRSNGSDGTSGQILTSNGAGVKPTWQAASGGGGASTLAVGTGTASNFTTNITSPTAAISFNGALFRSVASGSTNFINIDTITTNGLLMISSASATYLTLSSASATYFPITSSTTLLTTSSATATYVKIGNLAIIQVASITTNASLNESVTSSTVTLSINPSSGTLQGNTFNGNSQLLQLSASGLVPNANVDGSSITKQGILVAGSNITLTPAAGTLTIAASGVSGTPGGSDTMIQINKGGVFAGTGTLTMDTTNNILTIGATTQFTNVTTTTWLNATTITFGTGTVTNVAGNFNLIIGSFTVSTISAPSSQSEGLIWADGGQKSIASYTDGIKSFFNQTIFSSSADATISNTVTETTFSPAGIGSLTLPANFFTSGKTLRIKIQGVYSSSSAATTDTFKVKLGTFTVISTATANITASQTNQFWFTSILLTGRATGVAGSVIANAAIGIYDVTNGVLSWPMTTSSAITVDTTLSLAINLTNTFSLASPANSITATNYLVTKD